MTVNRVIRYFLVVLCAVVFIGGPDAQAQQTITGQEVRKEVDKAAQTTKAYASQQMEAYRKEMRGKLDGLSGKLEELKQRAKAAQGEAATKSQQVAADLQAKMDAARKELRDLSSSGSETWNDVKARFDKAMADLNKTIDDALGRSK